MDRTKYDLTKLSVEHPEGLVIHVTEYTSLLRPSLELALFISKLKAPIATFGKGRLNLGPTLIFSAGAQRICTPETIFQYRLFERMKASAKIDTMPLREQLEPVILDSADFIHSRTGLHPELIISILMSERVISAEEAYGLGMVNSIQRTL
ncbi:MAG TPA: hypothetical protein PKD55_12270 [Bellilinea sp.]|nr:hypothetical protein [Bellilinea sp.]